MSKKTDTDQRVALNSRRRQLLQTGLTASTAALIPLVNTGCVPKAPPSTSALGVENDAILAAFADRIFPADELSPAASQLGVVAYVDRSLHDWNKQELPVLKAGLRALNKVALAQHGVAFTLLSAGQQDGLLAALENDELAGISPGAALFSRLQRLVMEGVFSDPYYGGNANFAGWDLIGYPGAVMVSTADMQKMRERLPALHTSAYGAEHDGH
jgi:hypothetical protein